MAVTGTEITLTLRETKTEALTHAELDGNQAALKDAIENHGHDDVPAHTHAFGDLDAIPSDFPPAAHTHSFGDLENIPSEFPPASHSHNYAPALTADENYVTDAEKSALHEHDNKIALDKLGESSGAPTWGGQGWPGVKALIQEDPPADPENGTLWVNPLDVSPDETTAYTTTLSTSATSISVSGLSITDGDTYSVFLNAQTTTEIMQLDARVNGTNMVLSCYTTLSPNFSPIVGAAQGIFYEHSPVTNPRVVALGTITVHGTVAVFEGSVVEPSNECSGVFQGVMKFPVSTINSVSISMGSGVMDSGTTLTIKKRN